MISLRLNLDPDEMPTHWYKAVADLANRPAPAVAITGSLKPLPEAG